MLKSFAGGRLFGAAWGTGPARVLALHGWRRSHVDFTGSLGGGEPPAVAVDLAGFGATPPPDAPWGSPEYACSLAPLFDPGGPLADRVVLVGHSFGGRVGLHLASLVPDRIERLVLTGVPLLHRQDRRARPASTYRLARRLHRMGLLDDRRMDVLRDRYGSPDYRAAAGVMRALFVRLLAEEYEGPMAAVTCPVDLLWGDDDTEVPPEVAVRAAPHFARAALETLPGVGHLVPTEAPAALRRVVLAGRDADAADGAECSGHDGR